MDAENILKDHNKFHGKGPKELCHGDDKDVLFAVQVQKQVSVSGEQMAIQVPIFKSDTREAMNERLHLAYEIMGERMGYENAAVEKLNQAAQDKRRQEHLDRVQAQQDAKLKKLQERGKLKVAAPANS